MKKLFAVLLVSLSLMGCSSNLATSAKPTTEPSKSNADANQNQDTSKQNAADTSSQSKSGDNSSKDATEAAKENTSTDNSDSRATVKIISISNPVPRNSTVTLTAKVSPNTTAHIIVDYGKGPSHAAGLETRKSDAKGTVSWSWHVGESTELGSVSVKVTSNGASATTKFTVVE